MDDDHYTITMAVAGFTTDDLEIEVKQNMLRVSGQKREEDSAGRTFLHRGIANRSFERSFQLADHIRVANASIQDGMLEVQLVREIPEEMKPRRIEIQQRNDKVIESQVDAA